MERRLGMDRWAVVMSLVIASVLFGVWQQSLLAGVFMGNFMAFFMMLSVTEG